MIGIVLVRVKGFFFFGERDGVEEKRHLKLRYDVILKSLGFGLQTVKMIPSSRYTTQRTSFRTWKVLGNVNGCYWFKKL